MGLFGNLFGKKAPDLGPADLGLLKCDVHSHFIPGIDDGAQTVEQSVELISAMHELGFTQVITTPHVMADGYRNTPEIILGGLETVRRELHARGIPVEVEAAAEYYLDHELDRLVRERSVLTFGDRMLLFELRPGARRRRVRPRPRSRQRRRGAVRLPRSGHARR